MKEELKRRERDEKTMAVLRKGDAWKVAVVQQLRRETTMTLAWIEARLQMGARTHLARLLYWHGRGSKKKARYNTID